VTTPVPDRPTIVFFPEGAYGPTNNCIGIGQVLRERGARVIFIVEESFAGTLEAQGFEERLMRLQPPPEVPEAPGQFWKDFIRETAPEYRKNTYDQLETVIKPIWAELISGAKYVDDRLVEILDEVRPDVAVEDNVVAFPAFVAHGAPWVRIISCNPLELKDPELPPPFSALPVGDRSDWAAFRSRYEELHADMHADFDAFVQARGCPPLPPMEFIHESPYLNLYLYPPAADYERSVPLAPTWHNLGTCVRRSDEQWEVPASLGTRGKLVYLSLGSLGSADVPLMQRFIDLLGRTEHRIIVSMGPQHAELRLHDNMWGAEQVPQPAILPHVDAVVTHGGNNTVTEAFFHGKPMIAHSLFWDQHDNARRVDELGFGTRLHPYAFTDDDLLVALERHLEDDALRERMRRIAAELQARPGTVHAADLIWRVAEEKAPIHRSDEHTEVSVS
jgi:MGT family glycosyltransferase